MIEEAQPQQQDFETTMRHIGATLDKIFNGDVPVDGKRYGFALLVTPFDPTGENKDKRCQYISNILRSDVITMLKEQLARFEGQTLESGHA